MQIIMAVDSDQRNELEAMIKDLEEENKSVHVTRIIRAFEGLIRVDPSGDLVYPNIQSEITSVPFACVFVCIHQEPAD